MKLKYLENTCPSVALSTTNPTWPDQGLNPVHFGVKPVTNHLIYGTASICNIAIKFWRHVQKTMKYFGYVNNTWFL
jgi:hypothetical protein